MSLIGNTNEQKIWNYLYSKIGNAYGVAGLMGNLRDESGLNPKNMQDSFENSSKFNDDTYTIAVDNGTYTLFAQDSIGFGLAQWTSKNRKKKLYEFAKLQNKSISDLEMQLDFLYKELNEDYKPVLTVLESATTIIQASNIVLMKFECPFDQGPIVQNRRTSYGQMYYDKYIVKITVSGSSVNLENTGSTSNNANTGGNETMKYNANNKPLVCMQTNSTCYKNTSTMVVKGVLWHSTGANNPWLKRYVQPSNNASDKTKWLNLLGKNQYGNDWNHISVQAGLNAWIGKLADGTVATVQSMPWNYRPWGCGSGSRGSCNNGWIQFEIAEDSLNDKDYFNKVYQEACELTAYLCSLYSLNPNGFVDVNGVRVPVILCHKDSHNLGMGSGHADVYHWFNKYGKSMDDVRKDVAALMSKSNASPSTPSVIPPIVSNNQNNTLNTSSEIYRVRKSWSDAKSQIGAFRELKNAKAACDKSGADYCVFNSAGVAIYPEAKFSPYLVRVTTDSLNIRKGAGTNYNIVGAIKDRGVYTIVKEAAGQGATKWGLLKSYQKNQNGWISLDFVKKI